MELAEYNMMFAKVKKDLGELQISKERAEEHLAKVNNQIDILAQTHNALAPLLGEALIETSSAVDASVESITSAGISHRVRLLLDANEKESFTAAAMRDRLAVQGWDWSKYVNPNATLHTVLVRLAKAGHAIEDTRIGTDGAKSFYSAKRTLSAAPPPPRREEAAPQYVRGRGTLDEPIGPLPGARYRPPDKK